MTLRPTTPDVFRADDRVVLADSSTVEQLRAAAEVSPRKRARLCAHRNNAAAVHEMLIVLARATYVRPHKHLDKSESFHVVAGTADVVLFDEAGAVERAIALGDYASGRCFYYRLADPVYHTVLVRSETVVLHETTRGPFDRAQTVYAPWAPDEGDATAVAQYLTALDERLKRQI